MRSATTTADRDPSAGSRRRAQRLGVWRWAAALCFGAALPATPAAAQILGPTTTTEAPVTTTTPPPTTVAPATTTTAEPATTEAPATTVAGPTTAKKAPPTTVAPTTTTPEQLPTLPPLPAGQVPAPTDTTLALPPSDDAARVSPIFPAMSIGGFTVALLIVVARAVAAGRPWR